MTIKASVKSERLVVDEPTDLPEDAEVTLLPLAPGDWLDETDRAALPAALATSRKGLFAGGDVVTGPNTVVDAIAAGKKAAAMIDRYLSDEELRQPGDGARSGNCADPSPARLGSIGAGRTERLAVPHVPASERRASFVLRVEIDVADTRLEPSTASRIQKVLHRQFEQGAPRADDRLDYGFLPIST